MSSPYARIAIATPVATAAELDPIPLAQGMLLSHRTWNGNGSRRIVLNVASALVKMRFVQSVGRSPLPSPSMIDLPSPGVTCVVFQMSRAMPMQSKPGPMFALVAGARTVKVELKSALIAEYVQSLVRSRLWARETITGIVSMDACQIRGCTHYLV